MKKNTYIQNFRDMLTPHCVLTDPSSLETYGKDWTKGYPANPSVVLFPKSTTEVSQVVSYCSLHDLPIVPSGGRTGLAGGAVASHQEIILSLEKMNRILEVDPINLSIKTEAGVTLQALQNAANAQDLHFPLDLGAKGSCHIGGNVATNAGGLQFVKYGGAREQVLGMTVVLADGRVLNLERSVRKDNSGYDLKQWFIGSEGTLGIITRLCLRLSLKPAESQTCLLAIESTSNILEVIRSAFQQGLKLAACEYFTREALELVLNHFNEMTQPFTDQWNYYLLLELEHTTTEVAEFLEALFHKDLVADGVIPESSAQIQHIWSLRENITEALAASGPVRKNDISIPISKLPEFESRLKELWPNSKNGPRLITFGHVGDGNLHLNYLGPPGESSSDFYTATEDLEKSVYTLVQEFCGSISAEHGIGLLKKEALGRHGSPLGLELMKKLKETLDPKGILNPGKIFPNETKHSSHHRCS